MVRRYLSEVWDRGNFDAIGDFLSGDYRRYGSPTLRPLDKEGQIARLSALRAALPDIEIRVDRMLAEGDLVAIQGTMRGTHLGEIAGMAPTGKEVVVGLADVIRLHNGRFAEHWGGPDMADLSRQIKEA